MSKINILYFLLVCIFLFLIISSMFLDLFHYHTQEILAKEEKNKYHQNLSITITYDNYPFKPGLKTSWGFSCLIRGLEETILFDTGGDGTLLLENMKKMDISPQEIDLIVLSHIHGDHVGGLEQFLKQNAKVDVYLPQSFPDNFKEIIEHYGAQVFGIKEWSKICSNAYTTGELGMGIKEQSLILQTELGMIVVTGCAHPGIVDIVKKVKDLFKDDVLLVMGGFHLMGQSQANLEKIITEFRDLGVRYVAPSHCSGDLTRQLFRLEYKNNYVETGVGKTIHLFELIN